MIGKLRKLLGGTINFIKTRLVLSVGIGVVVATAVILLITSSGDDKYDFITAKEMALVQEVSITGQVRAVEDANLAFEQTGIVAQVLVSVGDEVKAGQTLVTLRNADIASLLAQANAQTEVELAILNNLGADTDQELESSYVNALNTINNALAKSEDAIRSKSSAVFSGSKYSAYYLKSGICNSVEGTLARKLRLDAELELEQWAKELKSLQATSPSRSQLDTALSNAKSHLDLIRETVDAINGALLTKCATENSALEAARTDMAIAQTNVATVIDDVNDLIQTIALNKISTSDVEAQEARVRAAEASAANYIAQLEKTIIRSPINGVVTKQDAKIGESVSVNTTIVSVISTSGFEMETYIPEADISKVKVGNVANVTLDAYGDDVLFGADVITIDIGETVIEGVTTYKTILQFTEEDERIKPGMTANINILTAERNNVIAIPQRAVASRDGQKFVKLLGGEGEVKEVVVETGLRGSDGNIEITAGVNAGDKVITFVREEN